MKSIYAFLLLILVWPLLPCQPADAQRPKRQSGPPPGRRFQTPPLIEFLGWDYAKLGYTLTPGEEMALRFRNSQKGSSQIPIAWKLTTYAGEALSQGQMELKLQPGEIGQVPIPLPPDFKDGAYFVKYSLDGPAPRGERRFHFDFRRPIPDGTLNLNIVALIENMDAEGWTRMMLGPLAPYVNVLSDWPGEDQPVDAVLVIAETIDDDDPRLARLKDYVKQGGKMLLSSVGTTWAVSAG